MLDAAKAAVECDFSARFLILLQELPGSSNAPA